jgi:hypothetical protein
MERPRAEPSAVPSREVDFTVPRQFRSVDYSDGVQDPQWKRTDFPWKREIEVRVWDINCSFGVKSRNLIVLVMQVCGRVHDSRRQNHAPFAAFPQDNIQHSLFVQGKRISDEPCIHEPTPVATSF